MARRGRGKRRRDESDDEEIEQMAQQGAPMEELSNEAPTGLESELDDEVAPATADAGGDEDDADENDARLPASPSGEPKRKRVPLSGTPTQAPEEAELARRRRRRQSLVFQKRRQSLTPSTKNTASGAVSDDGEPRQNRQYISDMYSTIIKMSSENKINIKNTWSLHLIDHMEDILSAPQQERPGAVEDPNTFNFQKASCTLDASIKIYSYRVDDTWTSSYKILENLSRSGAEKRADHDEGEEEDEDGEGGEEGEEGAPRRGKKKSGRKPASAARTIEKNLNNITLKSYELDFEPDPLFHKMSQTFDEGGAKGMLLANLGVYDGAKILLNSADVRLSTRKTIEKKQMPVDDESAPTEEEPVSLPKPSKIDMSALGKLGCFSKDVTSMAVCPPLTRLYDQIAEMRDPSRTQPKIVLKSSVLVLANMRPKPSDEEAFVPSTPIADDTASVAGSVENGDEDAAMEDASELPPIEETEGRDDIDNSNGDDDDDDDNNEPMDDGFEFGGGDEMDVDMEDADTASSVSMPEAPASIEETPVNDSVLDEDDTDGIEPVTERQVDPVTDPSQDPQPVVVKSAADYFRSQMEDDSVKNEEDVAYSQLIETALMRSVILEAEGTEVNDGNDYSYFDTKMMKNWAGPSHLKFKGARRMPTNLLAFIDEQEEGNANAPAKRGRKPQQKKTASMVSEKRSLVVDFASSDVPDFAKLLKIPKAAGSTMLTKLVVKRQMQKSAELVFPVDAHIESKIFFRHFLKPRLQLFHRRLQPSRGMEADDSLVPSASDPGLADADNLAYEDGGHDFGAGGFSDDDDSDNEVDREGSSAFFASAGLITAERVVEKVDVHYERVAKRVDVKKLKTSIWSHLAAEAALLGKRKSRQNDHVEPEPEMFDEGHNADGSSNDIEPTTFENVVQGIAGKVPSNVTVSFYFICMLHLANEKGLRLTGKEDLSDFAIKKEEPLVRN